MTRQQKGPDSPGPENLRGKVRLQPTGSVSPPQKRVKPPSDAVDANTGVQPREGIFFLGAPPLLDPNLSDKGFRALAYLALHANRDRKAWPGQERIASVIGLGERQTRNLLKELADAGYITRKRRRRESTLYTLRDREYLDRFMGRRNQDRQSAIAAQEILDRQSGDTQDRQSAIADEQLQINSVRERGGASLDRQSATTGQGIPKPNPETWARLMIDALPEIRKPEGKHLDACLRKMVPVIEKAGVGLVALFVADFVEEKFRVGKEPAVYLETCLGKYLTREWIAKAQKDYGKLLADVTRCPNCSAEVPRELFKGDDGGFRCGVCDSPLNVLSITTLTKQKGLGQ